VSTATTTRKPAAKRFSQVEALTLWRRYRATGDPRLRDRLIMTYAPLVKHIVYRKIREVPSHQEADDYISRGLEALITSIDRYDPSKGATLEQFLWTRIHGAVLDELRRQDWAPRSVRRFDREVAKAARSFRAIHGREPRDYELADALAVSVEELRAHRADLIRADVGSLNATASEASDDDAGVERVELIQSGDERLRPEHAAMIGDTKRAFREAFDTLSTREQEICILLYVKHLTLREVGEVLGVTESRVSQLHSGIRTKLRKRLQGHEEALTLMDV
jgi:RNA polymerase sigma factor for flagellar operon FliA